MTSPATTSQAPQPAPGGFLRHAAIYGLGALSLQLVSILLMPVYTAALSQAEYGLLQTIYRVGSVLHICLMVNGLTLATFNLWGRGDETSRRQLAPSVLYVTLVVVVSGILVSWIVATPLAHFLNLADAPVLALGMTTMLLQALALVPFALMQARKESKGYVIGTLAMTITQLSLVCLALLVANGGVKGVLFALMTTYGIFGTLLMARELAATTLRPCRQQIREMVGFAIPFIPSGLFFFILHSGDQFFLLKYHGLAAVGVYALAYKLTSGAIMLGTQPCLQVWKAWMYEAYQDPHRAELFGRAITRILSIVVFVGTALVLFQHEILSLLATPAYYQAALVIPILVAGHLCLVLGNLVDSAFYVTQRTDLKPWIAGAASVVMTVAYAVLIPWAEIVGAAWATLIGFAFYAGLNLAWSRKVFAIQMEYTRLGRVIGVALAVTAVAQAGTHYLDWHPTHTVDPTICVAKSSLLLIFPVALWTLGIISPQERTYLRQIALRGRAWLWGWGSPS